jgi:hypothetical protein
MSKSIEKIIDRFNDDPEFTSRLFNRTISEMLVLFIEKNVIELVDESVVTDYLDLVLYYKLTSIENKKELIKEICDTYFNDVFFENDKPYLLVSRQDIPNIFDDYGRDSTARWVAKAIFSEDYWEPFDNYPNKSYFYDSCIETLNSDNKYYVANAINDELLDSKVEPTTDLLEQIAEEQGHPEYLILSTDLIFDIMEDEESFMDIAWETQVASELSSAYNSAYNEAYSDELYNDVYDGIMNFFNSPTKPEITTVKSTGINGKEYLSEYIQINISNSLYDFIYEYLSGYKDTYHNIDYFGNLFDVIVELIAAGIFSYIDFRIPDYADSTKTDENYNSLIKDYI